MFKYNKGATFASDAYGSVSIAELRSTKESVFLRELKYEKKVGYDTESVVRNEIQILKQISENPLFLSLKEVVEEDKVCWLVFEKKGISLEDTLWDYSFSSNENEKLPEDITKKIMYQLCKAVEFYEQIGMSHRDINPSTLFLDQKTFKLSVADFGLGRSNFSYADPYWNEFAHQSRRSLAYIAPEVLAASIPTASVDMWSVGCIFAQMLRRQQLFPTGPTRTPQDLLKSISELVITPGEQPPNPRLLSQLLYIDHFKYDEDGFDLLYRMLQFDRSTRITAKKALGHRYFYSLDGSE